MPTGVICTSSHKIDQVRVSHLDQSRNFSLKLFCQIVLTSVLPIVLKLEFFDSYIVFFVCCLEDVCTCTSSNLFLEEDVLYIDPEVILRPHELLA